jgi:large subunit ribosomal protein L6
MSRIGRKPITVPSGVTVEQDGALITVKGPKGTLTQTLMPGLKLVQNDNELALSQTVVNVDTQKSYGLMRSLINNMVIGVSAGFERRLEINGVGFRASISGNLITLSLGFSHPVLFTLPEGITGAVEKNLIILTGFDKQLVGQVAANIRTLKKPEPYKGKGIKYIEEHIKRKAGKTAAKG